MSAFRNIIQFANVLSLDVVLGSMAGMVLFSEILNVSVPVSAYLLLGMAVWSIYTLDHLWDAKCTKGIAHSKRHLFHQVKFKEIAVVWIIVFLLGIGMAAGLDELQFSLAPGLIIGLLMAFWMTFIRWGGEKLAWLKEFSTAAFYVIGIVLVPFLLRNTDLDLSVFFVFATEYFFLAWLNLLILSYWDKESDQKDGFVSITNLISPSKLNRMIIALSTLGVLILIVQFWVLPSYFHIYTGLILIILLIHILKFLNPSENPENSRQSLEASFLIPLLLLVLR